MAVKKVVTKGVGSATKTNPNGAEDVKNTEIMLPAYMVPAAAEHAAEVGVKMGMTKNLGNFESLRLDVSCSIPCISTVESMDAAFVFCRDWCDNKMIEMQSDEG